MLNLRELSLNAGDYLRSITLAEALWFLLPFMGAALLGVFLYRLMFHIPPAWERFLNSIENRLRAVVEWPRKRKMRREKQNQIDNRLAATLEDELEKMFNEGEIDGTTQQKLRHRFGRVLSKMKPKKDVKAGIRARLRKDNTPVPLPDATVPVAQSSRLAKVFSFRSKKQVA